MMTVAPSPASASAMARPIPAVLPVTNATLPCSSKSMSGLQGLGYRGREAWATGRGFLQRRPRFRTTVRFAGLLVQSGLVPALRIHELWQAAVVALLLSPVVPDDAEQRGIRVRDARPLKPKLLAPGAGKGFEHANGKKKVHPADDVAAEQGQHADVCDVQSTDEGRPNNEPAEDDRSATAIVAPSGVFGRGTHGI